MRVKFRMSLGSRDAALHSLKFGECVQGMELIVPDKTGEWLIRNRIAVELPSIKQASPATELPVEILAVPDVPEIGGAPETAIKPETKSSRKKSSTPSKDE